nr:hypothetical protein [uncultured Roseateles sp.]
MAQFLALSPHAMATTSLKKSDPQKSVKPLTVKGTAVAVFSGGMALVDTSSGSFIPVKRTKRDEQTSSLMKKVGEALEKPGVSRKTVFPPGANISFVYSADPSDPSILVRKSADGKRERGRLVHGRFQALTNK